MKIRKLTCVFCLAVFTCAAAHAGESRQALREKRHALQAKLADLVDQTNKIKSEIARSDQLMQKNPQIAAAKNAVDSARKALDQKQAASPGLADARKAADEATKAAKDALAAELASDKEATDIQNQIKAAADARRQLREQERAVDSTLNEIRRRIAKDPSLKPAADALAKAEADLGDPGKLDAKMAAAAKSVADARKALDEKIKTLPEYQALAAAQKSYDEALKTSAPIAAAKQARNDARKTLDEKVAAKLATDPQGAAQLKKLAEIRQKIDDAEAQARAADEKLTAVRARLKANPRVEEAAKKAAAAESAYRKLVAEQTQAERAALDAATKAYNTRLDELVGQDPKGAELKKQTEELRRQIEEIRALEQNAN